MPFAALIPAAGRSLRMGSAKAWLELEGRTLLQRIVSTAAAAGAVSCVVVAGAHDDDDEEEIAPGAPGERGHLVTRMDVATRVEVAPPLRLSVALADPTGQLIDSIRAGLMLVARGCDVLLWPVDAPFADAALVRALVAALGTARERIAVPAVRGSRCHPVLFGEAAAAELAAAGADAGAHAVVRRDEARLIVVPAEDPRLVQPLNTPAEARALGIRAGRL